MSEEEKTEEQMIPKGMSQIDRHLTKEAMDHLWDSINNKQDKT